MPLTAVARSTGDTLRQEVTVDGRFHLVTDEPEHLGGTDEGATPHELLPAALASCIATTIRVWMRRKGWVFGDLAVEVSYDQAAKPRKVDVRIHVPADLTDEQRDRVLIAARSCQVRRSIEAGMTFEEGLADPALPA